MEQTSDLFIDQLRKRNRAACQRLVGDYGAAVFQLVRRIVGRQEDAEEVCQDVFVKALQGIDGYDSRKASFATWLSRIAYHESLNFLRAPPRYCVHGRSRHAFRPHPRPARRRASRQPGHPTAGAGADDASPQRAGRHHDVLLRQHEPRRHCLRYRLHSLYRRLATVPNP